MALEMFNSRGNGYTLYKKDVTLKSGYVSTIYFFVKSDQLNIQGDYEACDLPADREVVETRTGMLVLRKKVA